MNILMLRPQIELGGVSAHIRLLAHGLIEQGQRVQVATSGGALAPALSAANIQVLHFPFYPSTPFNLVRSALLLQRFVQAQHVDLLHSHHRFTTIIGQVVRAITHIPLIATVHEFKSDGKLSAALWAKNPTIVPSQALKSHLLSFYGAASGDVFVVPHALAPLDRPFARDRASLPAHLDGAEPGPLVGFIGRLSSEKGARFFLESIPLIRRDSPNARFVVAGAGPQEQELCALAAQLGLDANSLFLGNCDDVAALLEQLDLLVIPSLSESFSLVALEAMRAGCPVVATAVGGLPEVVRDGLTGVLVPPGAPGALAAAVAALLADEDARRQLGQQARHMFGNEYAPALMVARTLHVYQVALQASKKSVSLC